MKKMLPKISPGTLISQIMTGCLAYYLLMTDNCFHCSISYLIHYAHTLALKQHLTLLGLIPIYIAAVIFGAAMLGATIGRWIDDSLARTSKQKSTKDSFTSQI
tara:strand:+ start:586 stop:894 length:309 start_codon:yes stop_codon:yes gene_type:complete